MAIIMVLVCRLLSSKDRCAEGKMELVIQAAGWRSGPSSVTVIRDKRQRNLSQESSRVTTMGAESRRT